MQCYARQSTIRLEYVLSNCLELVYYMLCMCHLSNAVHILWQEILIVSLVCLYVEWSLCSVATLCIVHTTCVFGVIEEEYFHGLLHCTGA